MDSGEPRWISAQHEAAHAVVGHFLGAEVQEIVLQPAPIANGYARVTWSGEQRDSPSNDPELERPFVVYVLAGQIAELVAEGGRNAEPGGPTFLMIKSVLACLGASDVDPSRRDDIFKVALTVAAGFGSDVVTAHDFVKVAALEAERLVRRRWPTV